MSRVKNKQKNASHLQAMGCDDDHYIIFKDWKLNDFGTVEEQENHGYTEQIQRHSSCKIIYRSCEY